MNEMTDFSTHVTTGALVVYAIEMLKSSGKCPWLTGDTKNINRLVSAVVAAMLAFGITATGDASTGWVVQIPSLTVLSSGFWHWGEQWAAQQMIWDGVASKGHS